jgi:hypothetical protein
MQRTMKQLGNLSDRLEGALILLDRARAAGVTVKSDRLGLLASSARPIDPEIKHALSLAHDDVWLALRSERRAKDAIRRAAAKLPQPGHDFVSEGCR